uniref:Integrin-linked protein kinase-like n=1 Tax=Saccoglossus kowalevskii TaxID=10224 RepID=A0ABM0GV06_SACKO|nr:PREDICTED: integrin-linked protein kinase-like [Saccoglossus kowalevskii]
MDDIFSQVREGHTTHVRLWLDNIENDLNQGDDHGFSLLHWASMEGRTSIVDMLIQRGAKINITNMGDDTALHLAASHGFRDILLKLLHNKAAINALNEHGNTPLHYACFWAHDHIAEVNNFQLPYYNEVSKCHFSFVIDTLASDNICVAVESIVVDMSQAINFAIHIARGMQFLHTLEPMIPRLHLSSKIIMIDEDLTAKINMADYKFSFQNRGKLYSTAWVAPEALQRCPEEMNVRAADMWSFAVLLWELSTREVPFAGMSNMEIGMKVVCEGLRVVIPPGVSPHISKLMRICMNEDPAKRPRFDMILPILEKMKINS